MGHEMDVRNAGLAGAGAGAGAGAETLPEWLWGSPFRLSSVNINCEFLS